MNKNLNKLNFRETPDNSCHQPNIARYSVLENNITYACPDDTTMKQFLNVACDRKSLKIKYNIFYKLEK